MTPVNRLRALDLFRGLTVVGMIIVNSSGSDDVYRLADPFGTLGQLGASHDAGGPLAQARRARP